MKKKKDIYIDNLAIPVFKENISICFSRNGCYDALEDTSLIVAFADSFHDGNIAEAKEFLDDANAITARLKSENCILAVFPFNVTHGVIAHETFHLAVMILEKRGLIFSSDSEEAYAHLIDYLTDRIYETLDVIPN